jgi:cbb3-type cytochrome oxidase subunit 3
MSAFVLDSRLLVLSIILLIGSFILFRKTRVIPTLLLLVGSAAYFGAHLHDFIISLGMSHGFILPGSWLFSGCLERPLVAVPFDILRFVSLLFPIGFLWYALRPGTKRI